MNSLVFLQCNEINASFYCEQFCIRCKYICIYLLKSKTIPHPLSDPAVVI